MRVVNISYSDIDGGAARAAYRIHSCLRYSGVDSVLWVNKKSSGDWTVRGPKDKIQKALSAVRSNLSKPFCSFLKTGNPVIHSPAIFSSGLAKHINNSDADVVHLHWVQGEMLSIADIGQITKPVVWTLHDMWAFCGAEHYSDDDRWREGYSLSNRPDHETGFDLNLWTWRRKRSHWTKPIHIVTPSRWLGECVQQSVLMKDWPRSVVPNPIDTDKWTPVEQNKARSLLGIPHNVPLLLFGAMGGGGDLRKGFDLMIEALGHLRGKVCGLRLVVFGEESPRHPPNLGFPVHYAGILRDDLSLRVLYSAADVFLLPSRLDNLPNTGVEALASGTPVVAFDTAGLSDIVDHKQNGYLACPFKAQSYANGILWCLKNVKSCDLRNKARDKALNRFSSQVIAKQYKQIYDWYK